MQRAGRRRSGKPVLAVVGYTNAGKSSLLQALTHTDSGVEDRYWAVHIKRLYTVAMSVLSRRHAQGPVNSLGSVLHGVLCELQ